MRMRVLLIMVLLALPLSAAAATLDKTEQAAAVSIAARGKAQEGDFKTCAALYHQAWQMDSTVRGYLYSAARCEQKAGLLEQAQRHYARYLDGATGTDRLAAKAKRHLGEVRAARDRQVRAARATARAVAARRQAQQQQAASRRSAAAKAAKARADLALAKKQQAQRGKDRKVAWSSIGGGAAVAAVGGWLLWSASSDIGELEDDLARKQGGQIVGTSYDKAVSRQSSANMRAGAGIAMVGVGLAAAGFGTWMLLRKPQRVSLLPQPRGATLLVRF